MTVLYTMSLLAALAVLLTRRPSRPPLPLFAFYLLIAALIAPFYAPARPGWLVTYWWVLPVVLAARWVAAIEVVWRLLAGIRLRTLLLFALLFATGAVASILTRLMHRTGRIVADYTQIGQFGQVWVWAFLVSALAFTFTHGSPSTRWLRVHAILFTVIVSVHAAISLRAFVGQWGDLWWNRVNRVTFVVVAALYLLWAFAMTRFAAFPLVRRYQEQQDSGDDRHQDGKIVHVVMVPR